MRCRRNGSIRGQLSADRRIRATSHATRQGATRLRQRAAAINEGGLGLIDDAQDECADVGEAHNSVDGKHEYEAALAVQIARDGRDERQQPAHDKGREDERVDGGEGDEPGRRGRRRCEGRVRVEVGLRRGAQGK